MYTINRKFDWDNAKADANFQKHGISFEDASEALTDPDGIGIYDEDHSLDEERFHWIGLSAKGLLLVVFTNRHNDTIYRIISARCASRKR